MRTLRLFCFVICALSLSVNPLCTTAQTVRSRTKTIKRDKSFFYRGKNGGAAKLKAARRDAAKSGTSLNPLGSSPITPQQAPSNNECAGALPIAPPPPNQGSFSTTVNVADATTNPSDPLASCQSDVSRSVWYTFTPDTDGTHFISTCADAPTATTVIDPVMSIYTASGNCTGFTEIPPSSTTDGCDDDNCFTEAQAVIQTNLTAGVLYYIVVRQFSSAALNTGEADLQLRVSRPATNPPIIPGQVLISEVRLSANGNPRDDFVELYNNTNRSINVGDVFGVLSYDPALDTTGTEPNDGLFAVGISPGVVIPPRGYYLVTNILGNSYSLDPYARGNNRRTDFDGDYFLDNQGVAFVRLETNGALTNIDSVGFTGGNNTRFNFVEGTALPSYTAPISNNASFVRRQPTGIPQDTNNNTADFFRVSTDGEPVGGIAAMLGAPGPQNLQSPVTRLTQTLLLSRFDTGRAINASPNRVRDSTMNSVSPRLRDSSGTEIPDLGTFIFRRRFQNITGAPITSLRLRFIDLSTKPQTGVADARVIDGVTATVTRESDGASIPVTGLKLEPQTFGPSQPQPTQPQGGGFNSTVVLQLGSGGLANAATVDVEIKFAIVRGGPFRFVAVVESLP